MKPRRRASVSAVVAALFVAIAGNGVVAQQPATTQPPLGTQRSPTAAPGGVLRGKVGTREYRLYVPSAAANAEPMPLVVGLHGCWQTPEDFALGTRLNDVAERRGLLVVYPAQSRYDNPSRCWNWFDPRNQSKRAGEIAETLAIVDEVKRLHPVRGARMIALGVSAGAFMAVNLACAAPETWAGIGVIAGGPFRCGVGPDGALACMRGLRLDPNASAAACDAASDTKLRTIRASLWHGDEDSVVSAVNLEGLAAMLTKVTGAVSLGAPARDGATVTRYREPRGRAEIETWLVHGMGHAWSGGDVRGSFTHPAGPDATARMLDFLLDVRGPEMAPDSPGARRVPAKP